MTKSKGAQLIGYLGPEGTFTHQALERFLQSRRSGAVPYPTVADVISAVEKRQVSAGVVPIENSIEGAVTATLDGLAFSRGAVRIAGEILLPIHFDLFVPPGMGGAAIKEVLSHPHAFGQCRKYIRRRRLSTRAALSTAEACQTLRDHPRRGVGAIASSKTGAMYGLKAAARGIEDTAGAVTRFVFLSAEPAERTGWDKTSFVLTPKRDRPGSLVELLQEFSSRRINLSRIESRPLKTQLGRYCFFIDAQGHHEDAPLAAAVRAISQKEVAVKFLGSYPNATQTSVRARPRVAPSAPTHRPRGLVPIQKVGICGLGLIGGSLACALKGLAGVEVKGYDADSKTCRAAKLSGIPIASNLRDLAGSSDLIILAAPVQAFEDIFARLSPHIRSRHIVTDVGSVKAHVVRAARRLMPSKTIFIGGHPMAGSERSGFSARRADLFRGTTWVLTFDGDTPLAPYLRLTELLLRLGAKVVPMAPSVHDEVTSMISHLPHVIAYTLAAQADGSPVRRRNRDLAAGSFKDLVRVAGSSPEHWAEICRFNERHLCGSLSEFMGHLSRIRDHTAAGDFAGLRAFFKKGQAGYQHFVEGPRRHRTIRILEKELPVRAPRFFSEISRESGRIEEVRSESGAVWISVSREA